MLDMLGLWAWRVGFACFGLVFIAGCILFPVALCIALPRILWQLMGWGMQVGVALAALGLYLTHRSVQREQRDHLGLADDLGQIGASTPRERVIRAFHAVAAGSGFVFLVSFWAMELYPWRFVLFAFASSGVLLMLSGGTAALLNRRSKPLPSRLAMLVGIVSMSGFATFLLTIILATLPGAWQWIPESWGAWPVVAGFGGMLLYAVLAPVYERLE